MRLNALAAVLAVNVALAGALAWLWSSGERSNWTEPAPLPPALDEVAAVEAAEPAEVSRYRETLDRPLFAASRKIAPRRDPAAEGQAADALKDVGLMKEKKFVDAFMREVARPDTGLATYGENEVRDALKLGAVNVLLLSEGLRKYRYSVACPNTNCGYTGNVTTTSDEFNMPPCPKCGTPFVTGDRFCAACGQPL